MTYLRPDAADNDRIIWASWDLLCAIIFRLIVDGTSNSIIAHDFSVGDGASSSDNRKNKNGYPDLDE